MLDVAYANVQLLEILKRNRVFYGRSLVCCILVGLLCCFEFVELLLNSLVVDFLKQQFRLCQLMAGSNQIGLSETLP